MINHHLIERFITHHFQHPTQGSESEVAITHHRAALEEAWDHGASVHKAPYRFIATSRIHKEVTVDAACVTKKFTNRDGLAHVQSCDPEVREIFD